MDKTNTTARMRRFILLKSQTDVWNTCNDMLALMDECMRSTSPTRLGEQAELAEELTDYLAALVRAGEGISSFMDGLSDKELAELSWTKTAR